MGLLLLMTVSAFACAGVETPRTQFTRNDDTNTLRLQHLRLWTKSGYPLWLEVRVPRAHGNGNTATNSTLVFTTSISTRPRFDGCTQADLHAAHTDVRLQDVRYARTQMQLEADLGTAGGHYAEKGIVEDIYVSMPSAQLSTLVADPGLAATVCQQPVRFEAWQLRQIRQLLRDGQVDSASASARASTMLSSMEQ